jgi:hypothetical protein
VACANAGREKPPAGEYLLVSVNGAPLPATIYDDGTGTEEIAGGSVTLKADGTAQFATKRQMRVWGQTVVEVDSAAGAYTALDHVVVVRLTDRDTLALTRAADTLVAQVGALTFRYRRRPD